MTRLLDAVLWKFGVPRAITVDNAPEFISCALDRWAHQHGVELHFIQPGKPTQNAYVESLNRKFRDEFLSQGRWPTLARARAEAELFRVDYNEVRPHSALGYATPAAFAAVARASLREPAGGLSGKAGSDRPEAHVGPSPDQRARIEVQIHENQTAS